MVRTSGWFYLGLVLTLPAAAATAPIVVSPTSASVRSSATKQFSAALHGVTGTVTWSVNGIAGGNQTVGTISSTGLFTAPVLNPGAPLKIRAAVGNPASTSDATVTWLNPTPSIQSFSPTAVNVGTFTVTVTGKGFVASSKILLNGAAIPTTFVSSTALRFQTTIPTAGSVNVTVSNPDPGQSTSNSRTINVMAPIAVTLSPATVNVRLGAAKKFSAGVSNAVDKTVVWSVNGIANGNPSLGTIAADGTYTAPAIMPAAGQVNIGVASVASPAATAQSVVTLLNPVAAIQAITPNSLVYGTQTVTITGTGFVPGSQLKLGDTLFPTQWISPNQFTASVTLAPTPGGLLAFSVRNPDPGHSTSAVAIVPVGVANPKVSYLAAARFLEQASWGADAAGIAHVQQIGFDAWITEQIATPATPYKSSNDSSDNLSKQQSEFFTHAMQGPDQLRQRMAFALSQIFVVSGLKTGQARQMVPYQNLLLTSAFGKYRDILHDVTLSPTMGVYLDMVNNDRADLAKGTAPNENYGREVMQLFSLGTAMLNSDGSTQKDGLGNPLTTYDQPVITGMAHALTGWTYPGRVITKGHNNENYNGPMFAVEANHDQDAKTIVGGKYLPPGQTAQQDLDGVLDALAAHPNVAPFISLRLIQHLVISNPSPAYIARISQVFNNTHGDLSQVVRAILLDPEARQGDDSNAPLQVNGGHLREPVLFLLSMMKTLNASVITQNPVAGLGSDMGESLFYSPSVFNYYSPLYRTSNGLLGPEFQILTSATALVRANSVQNLVTRGLDGDARFDLGPFTQLAGSPADLVNALDRAFMYGRMPASLKASILAGIAGYDSSSDRVRNAIYLIATSSLYQVQH